MWHGMGGCRDISAVAQIFNISNPANSPDFFVEANEDARAEGIRWVEYMFQYSPQRDEESGTFTDEAWQHWKKEFLDKYTHCREKVPEVDFTFINIAPNLSPKYIEKFREYQEQDSDLKQFKFATFQVGSEDPFNYKEHYETAKNVGLDIVNVHAGEWNPNREVGVEIQKQWMRNAISVGAFRIGHGIIAHIDPDFMAELKGKDICLEICLFSNAYLDNVPDGLFSNHPLPILHRAGVPCCLSSDDPWNMGTWNTQGLVREYEIARDKLGMSNPELAQLAKNSFKYSLAPESLKEQAYIDIDNWLLQYP